jgi:hypothetical protein
MHRVEHPEPGRLERGARARGIWGVRASSGGQARFIRGREAPLALAELIDR